MYLPTILITAKLTEVFKDNLVPAIIVGTCVVKVGIVWIFPFAKTALFEQTITEFPEESLDLKDKIVELAESVDYPNPSRKIKLVKSRSNDLHSNASANSWNISLSYELLEHHKGQDKEILAILAHELGHWKLMHIYKIVLYDMVYMAIFAVFLQKCINNKVMFADFGFTQGSYFVSLFLFFKVYSVTIDYPLRKLYNIVTRANEVEADNYAIELGYGSELRSALIRNYAENLDALFVDNWYAKMQMSHPPLIERISGSLDSFKKETLVSN
jgi:STE24 endopeptidase